MLALTQTAAEAVETIVTQPEAPESAVLRVTVQESSDNSAESRDLQLAVAEQPAEDDVVMEGARIAVEPETLGFLDDKVLDAEFAEGGVKFSLYLQPQTGGADGEAPSA